MAARPDHLRRASDNEVLAYSLPPDPSCCIDWSVTMLFYAALHRIDAYLAGRGDHPPNHFIRDSQVERIGSIAQIYPDYRRLKDMSKRARHDIAEYTERDLAVAQNRLDKIKAHLAPLM